MADSEAPPQRSDTHDALEMFVGDWTAEGWNYGIAKDGADPKSERTTWRSTHSARWHTGKFFVIEDEKAKIGDVGDPFDTIGIIGFDPETGSYFSHRFENHGFERRYSVTRESERATVTFSDDGRTQTHVWEWKPDGKWLPLCDRTATKVG